MRTVFLMATVSLLLCATACSGESSSFLSTAPGTQRDHRVPQPSSPASPIPFKFQTIDEPNSSQNAVTGINNLKAIVGVYSAGSLSNTPQSYKAQPPYSTFKGLIYPGAQGLYATSLSNGKIVGGYVIDPGTLTGIWAFVRINGLYTLLADPNEGTGSNAVTEILGVNGSELAVGYYTNNSGDQIPFELNIPTETFTTLSPPGANGAEATGINGKGDISGWEVTSSETTGFYLQADTYYPISFPGARATYAIGLNWQDQLVGYYVDRSGATHGFLLTGPTKGGSQQAWQTLDEPNAATGTWITAINNYDDISGYYVDAKGVQHGFIAVPE